MYKTSHIRGWDWTELNVAFKLFSGTKKECKHTKSCKCEEKAAKLLEIFLHDSVREWFFIASTNKFKRIKKRVKQVIFVLDKFLGKLSQSKIHYGSDVWKAIKKIDDPWTKIQFFCPLIRFAWN